MGVTSRYTLGHRLTREGGLHVGYRSTDANSHSPLLDASPSRRDPLWLCASSLLVPQQHQLTSAVCVDREPKDRAHRQRPGASWTQPIGRTLPMPAEDADAKLLD
jgi:hypothetical protein